MTRSFWAPAAVAMVAGLVLLLAGAGAWVSGMGEREVGGVVVLEPVDSPGTQFAPGAVPVGLLGLAGGAFLAALRRRARTVAAVVVTCTGVAGLVLVGGGISRASGAPGTLTPAPFFAATAAAGIALAGAAAVRGPGQPPASSPYRVEQEQAGDDEWSLAAAADDEQRPQP